MGQTPPLYPLEIFPSLDSVHDQLHPEANPSRPSIDAYASALEAQGRLTSIVSEAIAKAKATRESSDVVVYIAGPLTGVSEELKDRYGKVSDMLATYSPVGDEKQAAFFGYVPHLHGTDPVKHPNVTPDEVRDVDFLWAVVTSDIHVNFLQPTAHGNAIEEGWAESRFIPTIYLNPEDNKLSRLTLGMNNIIRQIDYAEFEPSGNSPEEEFVRGLVARIGYGKRAALSEARVEFDELHAWLQAFPGRDAREFHYLSFEKLVNPALRLSGEDTQSAYEPEELFHKIDTKSLAAYIKDPNHKYYGQVCSISYVDDCRGIGVITQDGYPYIFDPFVITNSLSFWPIERGSTLAHANTKTRAELENSPDFSYEDVYGRE